MGYMVNSANPRLVLYDLQLNKRKRKFWPAKLKFIMSKEVKIAEMVNTVHSRLETILLGFPVDNQD